MGSAAWARGVEKPRPRSARPAGSRLGRVPPPSPEDAMVHAAMSTPVFRFAPSPNGELHLGHALSALVGYERARACGGRFLLRIEDIDKGRSRPRFVAGILADLAWLGLAWEEPVVFQSQRLDAYRDAARRLEDMGLLYPCFASRAEIE